MNAKRAKEYADDFNKKGMYGVIKDIIAHEAKQQGHYSVDISEEVPAETVQKLQNDGFDVQESSCDWGYLTTISWRNA